MAILRKGRYAARHAATPEDVIRAQQLRYLTFRARVHAGDPDSVDADAFDARCRHVLVEDAASGTLVCCFRLLSLPDGTGIEQSYSAQYYDLSPLQGYTGRMLEMGRFCIHPAWRDADILRVAWAALTRIIDGEGVEMLFGCSSFSGTKGEGYPDAFALLARRHLAPAHWSPRVKAPEVIPFAGTLREREPEMKRAMAEIPPLLRTYLLMGGWVSDHAVVDRDLNTLHVFTALEIGAIPPARARLLRALAI